MEMLNSNDLNGLEVAIIGMDCKFPKSPSINDYWENLRNGTDCISVFSDKELEAYGIPQELLKRPNYVKAKGIVEDIEYFDPEFFNYTPEQAKVMDPQLRILHECVYNAIENGGYTPFSYPGKIGLFTGNFTNFYWLKQFMGRDSQISDQVVIGSLIDSNNLSTRISYSLNLKGPSFTVQTACSTSLLAVHLACQSLLSGECDMAVAGGVSLDLPLKKGYLYEEGMIYSKSGHCKSFDADADGSVFSDGSGAVLLKPLENALQDGDHIYAIIKGSASNNDGHLKAGYTAPSAQAQADVIKMALSASDVATESISYVETHGTGTHLGDPIELQALKDVFGQDREKRCAIGSVKSNIGHINNASGIAGLIKTVLCLEHKVLVPSLYYKTPNPEADFSNSKFYVNTQYKAWENGQYPLRAGVSSFGIGGTNVHVVVEEVPKAKEDYMKEELGNYLVPISAKNKESLQESAKRMIEYIKTNNASRLKDIAYTLSLTRSEFNYRYMAICKNKTELVEQLSQLVEDNAVIHMPKASKNRFALRFNEGNLVQKVVLLPQGSTLQEIKSLFKAREYNEESLDLKEVEIVDVDTTKVDDEQYVLELIRELWYLGKKIDFDTYYKNKHARRIPLPSYPYARHFFSTVFANNQPAKQEDVKIADGKYYTPKWQRSALNEVQSDIKNYVILLPDSRLGENVALRLEQEGYQVIRIYEGKCFKQINSQQFEINIQCEEDYKCVLEALNKNILYKWISLLSVNNKDLSDENIVKAMDAGFYANIYLAKAIHQYIECDTQLTIVVNDAFQVTGREKINPIKAAISGLTLVIPQECPLIKANCIDINLEEKWGIEKLIAELKCNSSERLIAYRRGSRWNQTFEKLHSDKEQFKCQYLKRGGTYLIIGGLGRIGLELGAFLGKKVAARLVLTRRSYFPPKEEWNDWLEKHEKDNAISVTIGRLRELVAQGIEIMIQQLDLSNYEQSQEVLSNIETCFGKIDGIISTAGVMQKDTFMTLDTFSKENSENQFKAKIYGHLNLANLIKSKDLDFCIITSSLTTLLGGLGHATYCVANSFLDSFVQYQNQMSSTKWLCVDWDFWKFDKGEIDSYVGKTAKEFTMTPQEGINAFEELLQWLEEERIIVCAGQLNRRLETWASSDWKVKKHEQEYNKVVQIERPQLFNEYVPPHTMLQEELIAIWEEIFGFNNIGIQDDFIELGGDSLMGIQFVAKLRKRGFNISLIELFNHPNVEMLSSILEEKDSNMEAPSIVSEHSIKQETYPVSTAQKRMYMMYMLDKQNTSYNTTITMRVQGNLNIKKLEESFKELISRHEILHTRFIQKDNEVFQEIVNEFDFKIEEMIAHNNEVDSCINQFVRPFILEVAPLIRVGAIKVAESDECILVIDIHHIISDGVSVEILKGEVLKFYTDQVLMPLNTQYKDYVIAQQELLHSERIKKLEEYWLNIYKDEIPILDMPMDYKRPAVRRLEGNTIHFEIDKKLIDDLKVLCRKKGITLFIMLLASYNILLHKYTSQEEIIVGTPVAGRTDAKYKDTVGLFMNVLPIRSHIQSEQTIDTFIDEMKNICLQSFEHQDYPFDMLIEKLGLMTDPSRNPIFDTMFILQSMKETNSTLNDLVFNDYSYIKNTTRYDISFECIERENGLLCKIEYCTALFTERTIKQYAKHFRNILEQIVKDSTSTIGKINMLDLMDLQNTYIKFNQSNTCTNIEEQPLLIEAFEKQVKQSPEAPALLFRDEVVSYKELNANANVIAHQLYQQHMDSATEPQLVAIIADRSTEMAIAILGALKARMAYVPIDVYYPLERINYMLEDSKANVILMSPLAYEKLEGNDVLKNKQVILLHYEKDMEDTFGDLNLPINKEDLAYIIYTSGTSGNPKGVLVKHGGIANSINFLARMYKLDKNSRYLQLFSFIFDGFLPGFFAPLISGGSVIILDEQQSKDILHIVRCIKKHKVTHFIAVPPLYLSIMKQATQEDMVSLQVVVLAGDKASSEIVALSRTLNEKLELVNEYGPTETSVVCAYHRNITEDNYNLLQHPIQNTEILLLDKDLNPIPHLVTGEICVLGKGLAKGYLNNKALTDSKFVDHAQFNKRIYRTGDYGKWLPDGSIELIGRIDAQVKIRGYRIELSEIEVKLRAIEGIKEAVVVTKDTEKGDKVICAYYVSDKNIAAHEIRQQLISVLPNYMIPTYFMALETIPLTVNGKIELKALPNINEIVTTLNEYIKPTNEVESSLCKIWSEVLGIANPSVDMSFFELGANSLKIAQAQSEINKVFDIKLEVVELYQYSTIQLLAEHIANLGRETLDTEIALCVEEENDEDELEVIQNTLDFFGEDDDE